MAGGAGMESGGYCCEKRSERMGEGREVVPCSAVDMPVWNSGKELTHHLDGFIGDLMWEIGGIMLIALEGGIPD